MKSGLLLLTVLLLTNKWNTTPAENGAGEENIYLFIF